jgi:hypothetical protein
MRVFVIDAPCATATVELRRNTEASTQTIQQLTRFFLSRYGAAWNTTKRLRALEAEPIIFLPLATIGAKQTAQDGPRALR